MGVALLSGFGDLNVSRDGKGGSDGKKALEDTKSKKQGVVAGTGPAQAKPAVVTSMISQKDIDVSAGHCPGQTVLSLLILHIYPFVL